MYDQVIGLGTIWARWFNSKRVNSIEETMKITRCEKRNDLCYAVQYLDFVDDLLASNSDFNIGHRLSMQA